MSTVEVSSIVSAKPFFNERRRSTNSSDNWGVTQNVDAYVKNQIKKRFVEKKARSLEGRVQSKSCIVGLLRSLVNKICDTVRSLCGHWNPDKSEIAIFRKEVIQKIKDQLVKDCYRDCEGKAQVPYIFDLGDEPIDVKEMVDEKLKGKNKTPDTTQEAYKSVIDDLYDKLERKLGSQIKAIRVLSNITQGSECSDEINTQYVTEGLHQVLDVQKKTYNFAEQKIEQTFVGEVIHLGEEGTPSESVTKHVTLTNPFKEEPHLCVKFSTRMCAPEQTPKEIEEAFEERLNEAKDQLLSDSKQRQNLIHIITINGAQTCLEEIPDEDRGGSPVGVDVANLGSSSQITPYDPSMEEGIKKKIYEAYNSLEKALGPQRAVKVLEELAQTGAAGPLIQINEHTGKLLGLLDKEGRAQQGEVVAKIETSEDSDSVTVTSDLQGVLRDFDDMEAPVTQIKARITTTIPTSGNPYFEVDYVSESKDIPLNPLHGISILSRRTPLRRAEGVIKKAEAAAIRLQAVTRGNAQRKTGRAAVKSRAAEERRLETGISDSLLKALPFDFQYILLELQAVTTREEKLKLFFPGSIDEGNLEDLGYNPSEVNQITTASDKSKKDLAGDLTPKQTELINITLTASQIIEIVSRLKEDAINQLVKDCGRAHHKILGSNGGLWSLEEVIDTTPEEKKRKITKKFEEISSYVKNKDSSLTTTECELQVVKLIESLTQIGMRNIQGDFNGQHEPEITMPLNGDSYTLDLQTMTTTIEVPKKSGTYRTEKGQLTGDSEETTSFDFSAEIKLKPIEGRATSSLFLEVQTVDELKRSCSKILEENKRKADEKAAEKARLNSILPSLVWW